MITDWSNYTITENGVTYALNNLIEVDTSTPATLTIADGINTIFTDDDIITATYRKNIHGADVEEISKLYVQGATVRSQVGKLYVFDGTVNSLIYTAEQIIFDNGAQGYPVQTYFYKNEGTSGGLYTNNNKITTYSTGSQYQVGFYTVGANIKFNLTGAKYIKALVKQDYASWLWITTQAPTGGDGAQHFYNNSPAKIKTIGATQKEISLDISAISGEYYIVISCVANYNTTSWLDVFKWWIEY